MLGAVSMQSALGDMAATLAAMERSVSGLRRCDALGMTAGVAGEVLPPPSRFEDESLTRFERLAVCHVQEVLRKSGLSLADDSVRLIISTTKGNVELLSEGFEPVPRRAFLWASAEAVGSSLHCAVRPVVISNACISGLSAFVVARDMLLAGECRHVIVVGCDVLSAFIAEGFASFKSVSASACRPYDAARDGLTLGEACGAALLTVDASVAEKPFVYISGGAVTNDANHISGPSRTGDGLYYAIREAMSEAGVSASDAGFVNTHGTATAYNDEMESKAVAWAGLADTPLNALKGYIGHTLGASGVVETILCAEQLRRGYIFGTCGYSACGTSVPLRISADRQSISGRCCIKTASGFGGCNAAIVLDLERRRQADTGRQTLREAETVAEYTLPHSSLPFDEFIRGQFKLLGESNMKFYKMSDLCKALYVAAGNLLQRAGADDCQPVRRAVVLANSSSSIEADMRHQSIVDEHLPEGASPAAFVYTLPNVAAGELCIRHGFQGDNTFFIEERDSGTAERYARRLIAADRADAVVCGWCDKLGRTWSVNLKLLKVKQNK